MLAGSQALKKDFNYIEKNENFQLAELDHVKIQGVPLIRSSKLAPSGRYVRPSLSLIVLKAARFRSPLFRSTPGLPALTQVLRTAYFSALYSFTVLKTPPAEKIPRVPQFCSKA